MKQRLLSTRDVLKGKMLFANSIQLFLRSACGVLGSMQPTNDTV